MEEVFYQCPYCWSNVSVLVDTSIRKQTYIEDCEVCCNPTEFTVICKEFEVVSLDAQPIEQ
ncbi:MAG: CPXCG motif-containing cysteine-rich protein [Luteibaculaceae bacterium]